MYVLFTSGTTGRPKGRMNIWKGWEHWRFVEPSGTRSGMGWLMLIDVGWRCERKNDDGMMAM